MIFINEIHKDFYEDCIRKTNSQTDPYRKALFYALGLTDETRRHICCLYDFDARGIRFEGIFMPWQTGTSMRVTRIGFNLYNGFIGKIKDEQQDSAGFYSPYELFDTGLMPFLFETVRLRYPEYAATWK